MILRKPGIQIAADVTTILALLPTEGGEVTKFDGHKKERPSVANSQSMISVNGSMYSGRTPVWHAADGTYSSESEKFRQHTTHRHLHQGLQLHSNVLASLSNHRSE